MPIFGDKRAVAVHKATTHGQRNPVRELIRINECPLCRKHFTGVRTTGTHVLRSMQAKMCHTKASTTKQAVCNAFHGMRCPKCNVDCRELDEWQRHIAIHLMEVADNEYGGWAGHQWWEDNDGIAQGVEGETGGTQYLAQQATPQPHAAQDGAPLSCRTSSDLRNDHAWTTTGTTRRIRPMARKGRMA